MHSPPPDFACHPYARHWAESVQNTHDMLDPERARQHVQFLKEHFRNSIPEHADELCRVVDWTLRHCVARGRAAVRETIA